MYRMFGYGEDALTFWALRNRLSDILKQLKDQTALPDCLVFFRPSFGRRGGAGSAEFGEFDAILAASKNAYLIESKWDGLRRWDARARILLGEAQKLRHQVFSWYLMHWDPEYSSDWKRFKEDHNTEFQNRFGKNVARAGRLLSRNLEFVLTKINKHCSRLKPENIKNVILFFYNQERNSSPPSTAPDDFSMVPLDYSNVIEGHFVVFEK